MGFKIGIDSDPWQRRPGELINDVIEGTCLADEDLPKSSRFFGAWVWRFKSKVSPEEKALIKSRLEDLYARDLIRGAINAHLDACATCGENPQEFFDECWSCFKAGKEKERVDAGR